MRVQYTLRYTVEYTVHPMCAKDGNPVKYASELAFSGLEVKLFTDFMNVFSLNRPLGRFSLQVGM